MADLPLASTAQRADASPTRLPRLPRRLATWPLLTASACACVSLAAQADPVYIALGDSITFGDTDLAYVPSSGDCGDVAGVADALARRNGGVRPTVGIPPP